MLRDRGEIPYTSPMAGQWVGWSEERTPTSVSHGYQN